MTRDTDIRSSTGDAESKYGRLFRTAPVSLWELDITRIREALAELRQQGVTDFRAHVDKHPEFVRHVTRMMIPLDVNDASVKMFGAKSKEALLRIKVDDLFTAETLDAFREWLLAIAEGRPHFEVMTKARTLEGDPLDVWLTMTLPTDESGFHDVPACIMDMTAVVRAQRWRRDAEERLQEQNTVLLELAKSGELARSDSDAFGALAIEMAASMLDVERVSIWLFERGGAVLRCKDLYEHSSHRHSSGLELEAVRYPRYFAALARDRAVTANDARRHPDTGEFAEIYLAPLSISSMLDAPLRRSGKLVGVVCHEHVGPAREWTNEDQEFAASIADFISMALEAEARRRAERSAHQAQTKLLEQQREEGQRVQAELAKAKQALVDHTRLATIGQVAASIAHDLRNPLGAIRNAAYYLRRRLPEADVKMDECLGIIERETHVSDRIVSNLLEMSRAKEPLKEPVEIVSLVNEVFEHIERPEGVRLTLSPSVNGMKIHADPSQMRQVLTNLITNAIQAMDDNGEIRVAMGEYASDDIVTIADEGPGVRSELHERIFEPLFTTKAKGTGLGLAICRQIVEQHGGTLELVQGVLPGATFRIRLPRSTSPQEMAQSCRPPRRRSVLVVDDDRSMRTSLAHILMDEGHDVTTVETGEKAVRICAKRTFDVVLMDVRMPGIDGVEACRRIRALGCEFPVIMMSAYTIDTLERRALSEGAIAFLRKPLEVDKVFELIARAD